MTNQYENLTVGELDKLSAEKFDIRIVDPKMCHGQELQVKSGRRTVERWRPTKNMNHALECADKLDWQIGMYKTPKGLWGVHVESPCDEFDVVVKNESLPLAITIACLTALDELKGSNAL